ncbi:unnamed protein product, partial [marine sediment metagenome]
MEVELLSEIRVPVALYNARSIFPRLCSNVHSTVKYGSPPDDNYEENDVLG